MLVLGGVILIFIDNVFKKGHKIKEEAEITYRQGFIIGIWQCLAMIPGVSRSAASIIGGMQQKLTRALAAEFSFFLAVPTMAAATGYKLMKTFKDNPGILHDSNNIEMLLLGNLIAFVVAMLAIKFFISFLQKYGFLNISAYTALLPGLYFLLL